MNPVRRALLGFYWHRVAAHWSRTAERYWKKYLHAEAEHDRAEKRLRALPRRGEP